MLLLGIEPALASQGPDHHRFLAAPGDDQRPQGTAFVDRAEGPDHQLTLADAGIYDYICGLHPAMKGKIEVKE